MNKTIDVKKLATNYKKQATDNLKDGYLNKNVKVENYISFMTKIDEAERIITSTSYEPKYEYDEAGNRNVVLGRMRVNSATRFCLSVMKLIDLYTNITVDINNFMAEYDTLNEVGLIEVLISRIPEKEVTEFNTVISMTFDDMMTNKCSIQNYVNDKIEQISDVLNVLVKSAEPTLTKLADTILSMDEKEKKTLNNKVAKFMKK